MPCTYVTKTLTAGESYVLPAGAEIVFCNNSSAITSQDNCAVIPTTPPIVCYTFDTIIEGEYVGGRGWEYWERFIYNGFTVYFDGGRTALTGNNSGNTNANVESTVAGIWDALKADANISPLILGVAVYHENWDDGVTTQYGIKIRMYDLGVAPPILDMLDTDATNAFDGQYTRASSIGRLVGCGSVATQGNGQHRGCRGDIPCPEG